MIEMLRFLGRYLGKISRIEYVLCELFMFFGKYDVVDLHDTSLKKLSNYLKTLITYD